LVPQEGLKERVVGKFQEWASKVGLKEEVAGGQMWTEEDATAWDQMGVVACTFVNNASVLPMTPVCIMPITFNNGVVIDCQ
jgi:hypothetical protein